MSESIPAVADPTFITSMVNMVLRGCTMSADVFEIMGKGSPLFEVSGDAVKMQLPEGVYEIKVAYLGAEALKHPRAVPGFTPPPAPAPPPEPEPPPPAAA
jgi:hypothetical protein